MNKYTNKCTQFVGLVDGETGVRVLAGARYYQRMWNALGLTQQIQRIPRVKWLQRAAAFSHSSTPQYVVIS
jgi:hypothetical protein